MLRRVKQNFCIEGYDPDVSWPPAGFEDLLKDSTIHEHNSREMLEIGDHLEESLLPEPRAGEDSIDYGQRLEKLEKGLMIMDRNQVSSRFERSVMHKYDPTIR